MARREHVSVVPPSVRPHVVRENTRAFPREAVHSTADIRAAIRETFRPQIVAPAFS